MKNILFATLLFASCTFCDAQDIKALKNTGNLHQENCTFLTVGRNAYFILEPGYQTVYSGKKGKDSLGLVITVLNDTVTIGSVITRVVEEKETVNGKYIEISRNYFAFCKESNSVYYFGEDVDIYKNGKAIRGKDSWKAEGNNKAGIVMPGKIVIGNKYFEEYAPGIAMDRSEIISISDTINTIAGFFVNCLKTKETTPLNLLEKEFKIYAPGIGMIKEEDLILVKYGFIK